MEDVRDSAVDKIKEKLSTMNTALNKISYLEIVLKEKNFSLEAKRFILSELSDLYCDLKMYSKAAKAMHNKANIEITKKDKINSYLEAAEMYARLGDVDNSEQMFLIATREATEDQKVGIFLAKKNIYTQFANQLEKLGKRVAAIKFYEHLLKMDIDPVEKTKIKTKLKKYYTALGMFREAKLIDL